MKKTLSLILAVMMLLGCMSITAFAINVECPTCGGYGEWEEKCPVCHGHAEDTCPDCDGDGYLPCPTCGDYYNEGCPTCEGNQRAFPCQNPYCFDGLVETVCTNKGCKQGSVWVQCPDCGGKGYTIDYTHMSDSIEIRATITAADFSYEMVIPSATTLTDEAHENVLLGSDGKVSIANVKHPTDKLNIVYTVDLTNGDLVNGTNTVPTTYGISETADGTFVTVDDTTKVTVYKNKTIINSFVNVTADDTAWNNAPGGTYTASVTFNFECEEPVSVKKTIGEILGNDGTKWSNGTKSMIATLIGDGYYAVDPDGIDGHLWANREMTQNVDGNFIGDNGEGGTITFIMEDEKCTSFVIAGGYFDWEHDLDGTYEPVAE